MNATSLESLIQSIITEAEKQIPAYQDSPEDWRISEGNVAICIITDDGRVFGKVYGQDKVRGRQFYNVAWKKASQVWITGQKTGDYEKTVFGGNMDPEDSPIELPDLIGWIGGQPITIDAETTLSIGFSGFKGHNDLKIVQIAVERAMKKIKI
jgi:glc operon protein GlcG